MEPELKIPVGLTWRIGLALAGLVALIVGYYWVHKPFGPSLLLTTGGAALDVLTVVVLFSMAGGIGRRVLSRLSLDVMSRAERLALEAGIGLGIISGAAVLLGMAGLFKGIVLWPLLLVAGRLCSRQVQGWLRLLVDLIRSVRPHSRWTWLLAVFTGSMLLLALPLALAPPVAWDTMSYHLVGPQRYLGAGAIAAHPDIHFLGFPQLVEVLFGVAMSLFGRDTVAALVHFGFGLLALLAAGGVARRYAGAAAGWLSMALLMSATSVWLLMGRPYVDLAPMVYGALALSVFTLWDAEPNAGWLAVLGLLAGLALGAKYTAGGLLLALLVAVAIRDQRRVVRHWGVMLVALLLAFLPWLLKGWLLYGNPIYPYIFGGAGWDAQRAAFFNSFDGGMIQTSDAWHLLILPLTATVFGVEMGAGYSFTAGPWLLTLPLLLALVWRWLGAPMRHLARACLTLGVPLLAFWVVLAAISGIGAQTRLMASLLPVAAVAGALAVQGLVEWPRKPLNVYFLFQAVITITLLFNAAEPVRLLTQSRAVEYLTGNASRSDFLAANLDIYQGAMERLAELPAGARVQLMWEPRSYYCPPLLTCDPDILFDHWAQPLLAGKLPDGVFARWKEAGVTNLLVFDLGLDFELGRSQYSALNAQFPDALADWMRPIWRDGVGYSLYGWRERDPRGG